MTLPSAGLPHEPAWDVARLFPLQGEWTEEDYLTLPTNHLVEWVEGKVEVLPMPTERHQFLVFFLCWALVNWLRGGAGGWAVMAPMRLRAGRRFREPDVMYLAPQHAFHRGQQFWTFADLVMEVISPDDPDGDRVVKRGEYAQAGIREYWIIEPEEESVTILTLPEGTDSYDVAGVFCRGQYAASRQLLGFEVDVALLFEQGNG